MKVLAQKIKQCFPHWNEKIVTEDLLTEFCGKTGVFVFERETKHKGEFRLYDGLPSIQIDPRLVAGERLWVFAHEVGHVLFHHPLAQKFCATENLKNLFVQKMDFQANFFAAVSLIPKSEMKRKTLAEFMDEYNYPRELLELRQIYYERYKY